jgi:wyosine [tRNA(Phe)-imidazoG37] synthetase (radical SAM superfamily)
MAGIPLQAGVIYGPILSRRLGRSFGINLLPVDRKLCSFNCVYCQYGAAKAVEEPYSQFKFPKVDDVLQEVEKALIKPRTIEYLTFSGNGEPTLHPDFVEIVQGVTLLRNRLRPGAKLAILSNSSRVTNPEILSALAQFDKPMMKLDAGDQKTFQSINRPAPRISLNAILECLQQIPKLVIQSMLIDGEFSNVNSETLDKWVAALDHIQPQEIHIYSVARPTADGNVETVSPRKLQRIAFDLNQRYSLPVRAFW